MADLESIRKGMILFSFRKKRDPVQFLYPLQFMCSITSLHASTWLKKYPTSIFPVVVTNNNVSDLQETPTFIKTFDTTPLDAYETAMAFSTLSVRKACGCTNRENEK